jgi:hypothetical protein
MNGHNLLTHMPCDSGTDPAACDVAHASFGAKWLTKHSNTFVPLPTRRHIPEDSIGQQKSSLQIKQHASQVSNNMLLFSNYGWNIQFSHQDVMIQGFHYT